MTDTTSVWSAHLVDGIPPPSAGATADELQDDSGWTVYVHEDVYYWLDDDRQDVNLRKRVRYCLTELLATGTCARRKHVRGAAEGWVRTQLGGTGGSHYYLWWAQHGYPAVDGSELPEKSVLVRLVRHHDDTDQPLDPGTMKAWVVLRPREIATADDSELTEQQRQIVALDAKPVRLVKGFPGSGKTTSLHKAASSIWGDKALYLTFSSALASDAANYFAAFAAAGTTVDSMTFGELMDALGETGAGVERPIPLSELLKKFEERTRSFRPRLGKWARRPDELYAELHAYAFGMAVPLEFRDVPASKKRHVARGDYEELRRNALSKKVAGHAVDAAKVLEQQGLVDELFPSVAAARRLLDNSVEDLPANFAGYSAVMIDEVQDLTVVEAMFVMSVVGRIGRMNGQMPHLFVAGDESQTVRPAAFSWGWLGDVLTVMLGAVAQERDDITLTTNMRSPRLVAKLIEATRSHYRLLARDDRPGDFAFVEADVDREGKVLYCHAPTADAWDRVVGLFDGQLSAQLVVPGMSVPAALVGLDSKVATVDQVKGLGYDLVGVVDAGERQVELLGLAERVEEDGDRLSSSLGRLKADQFRVAVSRSQENLVLLDRGPNDRSDAIQDLVSDVDPDLVVRVDVDGLSAHLEEEVAALDLLEDQLSAAKTALGKDPVFALGKARSAVDLLPRAAAEGVLPPPLVADVYRVAGVAARLSAGISRELGNTGEATDRQAEADEFFEAGGFGDLYRTFIDLNEVVDTGQSAADPSVVLNAVQRYVDCTVDLPELAGEVWTDLSTWLGAVAAGGYSAAHDVQTSIAASTAVAEVFEARQPGTAELHRQALRRTAELAVEAMDFERALVCLESVEDVDVDLVARCYEGAGLWAEAIEHYEINDRPLDALRCARESADFTKALELARNVAPEQVGRIRWAQRLVELVAPELTDHGAPLSDAERRELLQILDQGLLRAMGSVPGTDDLVDTMWDVPAPVSQLSVDLTQPLDPYVPPVFEGSESRSDFSDEAELAQIESSAEPAASQEERPVEEPIADEVPAEVPEPEEFDAPAAGDDEIPAAQPFGSEAAPRTSPVEDGFVSLADLSGDLGRTKPELEELCVKLGIAVAPGSDTVTDAQADRIRGRVARENKG